MLDNFATVAEAVEAAQNDDFVIVTQRLPDDDRFAALHLSLSDPTGDSAIMEFIDGELVIHHDRRCLVKSKQIEELGIHATQRPAR